MNVEWVVRDQFSPPLPQPRYLIPRALVGFLVVTTLVATIVSIVSTTVSNAGRPAVPIPASGHISYVTPSATLKALPVSAALSSTPSEIDFKAGTCIEQRSCVAVAAYTATTLILDASIQGIWQPERVIALTGLPKNTSTFSVNVVACSSIHDCWIGGDVFEGDRPYESPIEPFFARVTDMASAHAWLHPMNPRSAGSVVESLACPIPGECLGTYISVILSKDFWSISNASIVRVSSYGITLVKNFPQTSSLALSCTTMRDCVVATAQQNTVKRPVELFHLINGRIVLWQSQKSPFGTEGAVSVNDLKCFASGCMALECDQQSTSMVMARISQGGVVAVHEVPDGGQSSSCSDAVGGNQPVSWMPNNVQLWCASSTTCTAAELQDLLFATWKEGRWSVTHVGSPLVAPNSNTFSATFACDQALECVGDSQQPLIAAGGTNSQFAVPLPTTFSTSENYTSLYSEFGAGWHDQTTVTAPPIPRTGNFEVSSVSCSPVVCALGGDYVDRAGYLEPFVANTVNGRWSGVQPLPDVSRWNAGGAASISDVACSGSGCTAVGNYTTADGLSEGFGVILTRRSWQPPLQWIPNERSEDATSTLTEVFCAQEGECVALGTAEALQSGSIASGNYNFTGSEEEWSESRGQWTTTKTTVGTGGFMSLSPCETGCTLNEPDVRLPAGTDPFSWFAGTYSNPYVNGSFLINGVTGIGCDDDGLCVEAANGGVASSGGDQAGESVMIIDNAEPGTFDRLPGLDTLEKHEGVTTSAENVSALACAAGTCTVVGTIGLNDGNSETYWSTWNGDAWSKVRILKGITPDQSLSVTSRTEDLSCFGAGKCVLVGSSEFLGPNVYSVESHGVWSAPRPIPTSPHGDRADQQPYVACTSFGRCTIASSISGSGSVSPAVLVFGALAGGTS